MAESIVDAESAARDGGVIQRAEESSSAAAESATQGVLQADLDNLAVQILPLIRKMLVVERERSGGLKW
jgi:hypothetical protein